MKTSHSCPGVVVFLVQFNVHVTVFVWTEEQQLCLCLTAHERHSFTFAHPLRVTVSFELLKHKQDCATYLCITFIINELFKAQVALGFHVFVLKLCRCIWNRQIMSLCPVLRLYKPLLRATTMSAPSLLQVTFCWTWMGWIWRGWLGVRLWPIWRTPHLLLCSRSWRCVLQMKAHRSARCHPVSPRPPQTAPRAPCLMMTIPHSGFHGCSYPGVHPLTVSVCIFSVQLLLVFLTSASWCHFKFWHGQQGNERSLYF